MGIKRSSRRKIQNVSELVQALEHLAPVGTAEPWDNVGLLIGSSKQTVKSAVVSIDLTEATLKKATQTKSHVIVTHHPVLFPKNRGASRVTDSSLIYQAIRKNISVIACHTNFDRCALEVPTRVAKKLGIEIKGRLIDDEAPFLKGVVFVPESHVDQVQEALFQAGAGQIGNYEACRFGIKGEGTFRGGAGTKPFLGKSGLLEKANEIRLETIFPKGLEKRIFEALRKSHPYEEIAYDFYPLEQPATGQGKIFGLGYGFWGQFLQSKPFSDVLKDVKSLFKLDGFLLTEPKTSRKLTRLAFVAGKGSSFISAALAQKCELFVTGEVGYHAAREAAMKGMAVLEMGHRESERFFLEVMAEWLKRLGISTAIDETPIQQWR